MILTDLVRDEKLYPTLVTDVVLKVQFLHAGGHRRYPAGSLMKRTGDDVHNDDRVGRDHHVELLLRGHDDVHRCVVRLYRLTAKRTNWRLKNLS